MAGMISWLMGFAYQARKDCSFSAFTGISSRTRRRFFRTICMIWSVCCDLKQLRGGTETVYLEPVGSESGTRPVNFEFPAGVRTLCDKYGALLIFDEVVTGFRMGLGGVQAYFGIIPDLTVFGMVIAGGYPGAGALGGINSGRMIR